MGAVLNNAVATYKSRRQPIGYRTEVIPVFKEEIDSDSLKAVVTLTKGEETQNFRNLSISRITLLNAGNQDLKTFNFGITLTEGEKAVYVKVETPDRHHKATVLTPVGLLTPAHEIDFRFEPFNRKEQYILNVFIELPEKQEKPGRITPSTAESPRFVEMPFPSEVAKNMAIRAVKEVARAKGIPGF